VGATGRLRCPRRRVWARIGHSRLTMLYRPNEKAPAVQGLLRVGAPRFELGTSSPPGFSAPWRPVRGSGESWLRYAKSTES
jgi:hypothetical protein